VDTGPFVDLTNLLDLGSGGFTDDFAEMLDDIETLTVTEDYDIFGGVEEDGCGDTAAILDIHDLDIRIRNQIPGLLADLTDRTGSLEGLRPSRDEEREVGFRADESNEVNIARWEVE
jgi:hypothetical protein